MVLRRLLILLSFLMLVVSALAGPGDGIQIGNLVINPFVEGTYTTDSNVQLDPTNEVDDAFLEGIGGIQFHYEREWFVWEGRLFGQLRRYDEFVEKDFNDWGERLTFRCGHRETVSVLVDQGMRRVTDYDRSTYFGGTLSPEAQNLSLTYDRSTRVARQLHDAGVVFGKTLGDTLELDVGLGTSWEDYETNALFDVSQISVQGEIGLKATDKMIFTVSGGLREEKNDSFDGTARAMTLQAGIKRRESDKLQIRLGLGADTFSRPEDVNSYGREVQSQSGGTRGINEDTRGDERAFSFDLAATWLMTDKIALEVAGHSAIQSTPQYPNTLDLITVGSMSIVYDLSDTLTISLTGSYREDDYLDPVVELGEEWIRLDERIAGLARIDYVPPRQFLTLFVEGGYEQSESTIDHYNYDQLRLSVGLSIRY